MRCECDLAGSGLPNSALVSDACVAALPRRAFFSAAQRER